MHVTQTKHARERTPVLPSCAMRRAEACVRGAHPDMSTSTASPLGSAGLSPPASLALVSAAAGAAAALTAAPRFARLPAGRPAPRCRDDSVGAAASGDALKRRAPGGRGCQYAVCALLEGRGPCACTSRTAAVLDAVACRQSTIHAHCQPLEHVACSDLRRRCAWQWWSLESKGGVLHD